ncbi:MAG: DUF624 domain-containing protein [bacterium]|nr:DUF624 domain-containing protein [bacterium]
MKKVPVWPIIKGAFVDVYDNLGWVLFISVVWFGFAVPVVFAVLPGNLHIVFRVLLGTSVIFLGPATAGAYYLANKLIKRESVEWRDYFFAFKKFFWRSEALILIYLLAIAIVVVDFMFYSQIQNIIVRVLSIFWLYILLFLGILQTYMFPLLIEQDTGIKRVIIRSFLLSIDNIGVSFVIFVVVIVLCAVCIITGVGALLLLMGVKSFFDTKTFLNVMEKYEDLSNSQK